MDIISVINEFEKDIEQNGGKFDFKNFFEWLKEKYIEECFDDK